MQLGFQSVVKLRQRATRTSVITLTEKEEAHLVKKKLHEALLATARALHKNNAVRVECCNCVMHVPGGLLPLVLHKFACHKSHTQKKTRGDIFVLWFLSDNKKAPPKP